MCQLWLQHERRISEMASTEQLGSTASIDLKSRFRLQEAKPNQLALREACRLPQFGTATMRLNATLLALAACWPMTSVAADFSLSGFGTLGFAMSDKSYGYQRFIDEKGTFRRDSVAGVQVDGKFSPSIGATVQVLASPSSDNDRQYDATVAWAFLSWRPTNDWLFRVGRQRIPLYLHSQNQDVGVTYEFVRLPTEMYSISPANEFNGIAASNSWSFVAGDLVVDGYVGSTEFLTRYWFREGIPQLQRSGPSFRSVSLSGKGLVFTFKGKSQANAYRFGLHSSIGKQGDGGPLPANYPFVSLFPGVGYFQVHNALPGPGVETVVNIKNTIATFGIELSLGRDYLLTGEYARTFVNSSAAKIANGSDRGFLSVLNKQGKWTPYITYAFLRSDGDQRQLYQRVNGNTVPDAIPSAQLINASQRAGADGISAYDQHSWAIGTSYALSPSSRLKAEWMRVRIGEMSSLVDAPRGSNIRNQSINVFSLSYSVVF